MIIGICGLIGSGKDTAADYLANFYGFRRESFAGILKDAISVIFGWDRELLEGRTKASREWREQVDTWWAKRLGIPHLTPRWVLQFWGTDVCRIGFHDEIWIASLENKLRTIRDNVVISDCRFPNEMKSIRNQNGKIVWIKRGPLPEWFDSAAIVNQGPSHPLWETSKAYLSTLNVHASETSWAGSRFDHVIDNNQSIDHLYTELRNLVQDPLLAREAGFYGLLVDS